MIFSSITQIYSAYPFGWVLCHFQAVDMISSRLLSSGFHPNTSFALSLDTKDGTCVRDYIHVTDLAQAHIFSSEISDQWWRKQYFQSWKWSWIHSERSY